jgi:hypothetical protein
MITVGDQQYDTLQDAISTLRIKIEGEGAKNPDSLQALGEVLALAGQADEAITLCQRAFEKNSNGATCIRLAEMLMRAGRPKDAWEHLGAVIDVEMPDDWHHRLIKDLHELADVFFAEGDPTAAMECYEVCARVAPEEVGTYLNVALKAHAGSVLESLIPEIAPAAEGGASYHATAVIWGETYANHFLVFCLPSILAPGNIPFLARHEKILFTIHACKENIGIFDEAPAVNELRKYAEVMFVEIPEVLIDQTRLEGLSDHVRYRHTLELSAWHQYMSMIIAGASGAGFMPFMPDWVLSDGCLQRAYEDANASHEIFVAPILVANRNPVAQMLAMQITEDHSASVAASALSQIGVANLHSSWTQFTPNKDSDRFSAKQFPSWMVWPFGQSGMVMHAFHWSVFMIKPGGLASYGGNRFWTIDHRILDALLQNDTSWDRVAFCADTNEQVIIAVDDEGKDYAWATDQVHEWGLPELVNESTPGTDKLSLSRANHVLFHQQVIFGSNADRAEQQDAVARANAMVEAIGSNTLEVSMGRV